MCKQLKNKVLVRVLSVLNVAFTTTLSAGAGVVGQDFLAELLAV